MAAQRKSARKLATPEHKTQQSKPARFERDRDPKAPSLVAERIRDLIARGALSPGVHLGQVQLAEQFKVSRVPVREALKLLAAEGLLQHDANRGFFVASLSSSEARQLYRMRRLIELEILKTVRWPTKPELARLTDMVNELETLLSSGERTLWDVRHREFHRAVLELSPEKVLVQEALRLWRLCDRYRSLLATPQRSGNEKATKDEGHLLRAFSRRDRDALLSAYEADRSHMEQMLLGLLGSRGL